LYSPAEYPKVKPAVARLGAEERHSTAQRLHRESGKGAEASRGPIPLGIVGLGVISAYYLAALEGRRDVELRAVCDLDRAKADGLLAKGVTFGSGYEELLARSDVAAVVVNVPNALHHRVCRAALLAGKDVCCEKPLALSADEALELTMLAEREERVVFTALHRRYNANVLRLARQARDVCDVRVDYLELISEHCGSDSWYLDPAQTGGGCVADNGPNAFSVLELFLGPLEVEAASIERDEAGVDVRSVVRLRSERGVPATVTLDWAYDAGERKTVTLVERDGTVRHADMLQGFPHFKQSLYHEYEAIVDDFVAAVRRGSHADVGPHVAHLVEETYCVAQDVETIAAGRI
jgi:predicted dehydrogenase